MHKVHPDRELERESITTDISIRELCRRHGIRSHSPVVDQAKKRKWQEKREAYRQQESEAFITKHAARLAEISDKALDAIDEAITKFRKDLRATKRVRQPDGSIAEEPVMRLMPKDVAVLLDRLQVLSDRPSSIRQQEGLEISTELPADALRDFIEATRGMGRSTRTESSPLPRTRRLDD